MNLDASGGRSYPREVLADAARHFEASHPNEACGAIVRLPDGALEFRPVRNAAEDPADGYAFDLGAQFALWAAQDRGELEIVAIAHSHCDAPAVFSDRDRADARLGDGLPCAFPGVDWLVFSVMRGERQAKCAEIRVFRWSDEDFSEAGALPAVASEPGR